MAQSRQTLEKRSRREFFDLVTKEFGGHDVAIELLDQEFGDQLEVERLPLAFIEYDDKDDIMTIAVGGRDTRYPVVLQHFIPHPTDILVDSLAPTLPWAAEIVDPDGNRTLVTVRERTALPRQSAT